MKNSIIFSQTRLGKTLIYCELFIITGMTCFILLSVAKYFQVDGYDLSSSVIWVLSLVLAMIGGCFYQSTESFIFWRYVNVNISKKRYDILNEIRDKRWYIEHDLHRIKKYDTAIRLLE